MVKQDITTALATLQAFLESYDLKKVATSGELKQQLKNLYKRYHAILVWHANLNRIKPKHFSDPSEYENFKLFFNESVSDLVQSIFLWSQGLYKPGYLIQRSSIENFLRCIGIHQRQAILTLKSTYDLIAIIRDTPIANHNKVAVRYFNSLYENYKILCAYVHTSDIHHMSLTTAVGAFPCFDMDTAKDAAARMREIIVSYCTFLGLMFPKEYRRFHHRDFDAISDILPANVRRELMQV